MTIESLEQYTGDLQANPDYKLNLQELVTALAILEAYKKGLQGQYLTPGDLLTNTEFAEGKLKQLATPFHSMLGKIFSGLSFAIKDADKNLRDFFFFNRKD
jgi:hypothetical protein